MHRTPAGKEDNFHGKISCLVMGTPAETSCP
jgi:hypothetical protein